MPPHDVVRRHRRYLRSVTKLAIPARTADHPSQQHSAQCQAHNLPEAEGWIAGTFESIDSRPKLTRLLSSRWLENFQADLLGRLWERVVELR
jgi:hypothetical protein